MLCIIPFTTSFVGLPIELDRWNILKQIIDQLRLDFT
jgi:hypothetical protein